MRNNLLYRATTHIMLDPQDENSVTSVYIEHKICQVKYKFIRVHCTTLFMIYIKLWVLVEFGFNFPIISGINKL